MRDFNLIVHNLISHQVPEVFHAKRYITTALEAMLVTLKRLSSGSRFADLVQTFDRSSVILSTIFFTIVMIMKRKVKEKMSDLNQTWMTPENMEYWKERVYEVTDLHTEVFAMLDGNILDASRPGK